MTVQPRIGALLAACALVLFAALPTAAGAEMVKLEFKPAAAAPPAPADLAPIAPFDAAWNPPDFVAPGNVLGNRIERPGDPAGATTDYVEYNRTIPQGIDEVGPLRGDLLVDFSTVDPTLPAVIVIHGGLQKGRLCNPYRRITQTQWAREFTAKGYIVFMADFKRPTNDRVAGILGAQLNKGNPGDCMADDGFEPGAKRAQISLQLAVRSLKAQLRLFADDHPGNPASPAFAAASTKVVAFGGSSGGHMAARLAMRSEDSSGAPGDGPQFQRERRVAGAVGIASMGECTKSNGVRNMSKYYGIPAFWPGIYKPFAGCGPIKPDALDSPIEFFGGISYQRQFGALGGKLVRVQSPVSGDGHWGTNHGWDGVVDARWQERTCDDINAFHAGYCTDELYKVNDAVPHYVFPLNARPLGAPDDAPTYWESSVFPQVDAFFRSVKADDAP